MERSPRTSRPPLLVTALCSTAILGAGPAAVQVDDEPMARLRAGELRVRVLSPTRAEVEARFETDPGAGTVELLLARFPGQTLAGGTLTVNAAIVSPSDPETPAAVSRIPVVPEGGTVVVRYTLDGTGESDFRFALPVPSAPPTEATRVAVALSLPPGAHPTGDEFPRFRRDRGDEGTASYTVELPAVPAFVRFGYRDTPVGPFGLAARIEILSLAAVILPLGAWALWRRRVGSAGAQSER